MNRAIIGAAEAVAVAAAQLRLLGGVSNIGNKKYYNRVFGNGIEPGLRRTWYAGFSYEF